MKRSLVVFYSRHGHTKSVGKEIAKELGSDVEELVDLKDRVGLKSWDKSAFDPELKKPTKIKEPEKKPMNYDIVIVGSPIWDGICPAIISYLKNKKFPKLAFFLTYGAGDFRGFVQMENLSKKPIARLGLQDREIDLGEHKNKIKEFCKSIKKFK